ncbi:unnamed protein product [Chrysoparadoxa australica]
MVLIVSVGPPPLGCSSLCRNAQRLQLGGCCCTGATPAAPHTPPKPPAAKHRAARGDSLDGRYLRQVIRCVRLVAPGLEAEVSGLGRSRSARRSKLT